MNLEVLIELQIKLVRELINMLSHSLIYAQKIDLLNKHTCHHGLYFPTFHQVKQTFKVCDLLSDIQVS